MSSSDPSPTSPAVAPAPTNEQPTPKRFMYFGYGSNMLDSILANKGCRVLSSTNAILKDYILLFNLKAKSLIEPSYANLEKRTGAEVHGVLYEMDEEDMMRMDAFEGGGRSYIREVVRLTTYDGREVEGSAYICYPNNPAGVQLEECPPSQRYLNVLITGAKQHKLKEEYIKWLENQQYTPLPAFELTQEMKEKIESKEYSEEELAKHVWDERFEACTDYTQYPHPILISLKGIVLDFGSFMGPTSFKKNMGGKDATFFVAGRVANETGQVPKKAEDITDPEVQKYVNATLADWSTYMNIMGHMQDRAKWKF